MKERIYLLAIVVSSLFVYLQWGTNQESFLWEAEWVVLQKALTNPRDFLHPFVGIPMLGQIILLVNLFLKQYSKTWIFIGIGAMAVLIGFITFVGILTMQIKIMASTLPFLLFSVLLFLSFRKSNLRNVNLK